MADGEFTVKLDRYLVDKIDQKAAATGRSRDEVVAYLLEQQLVGYDDFEWDEDPRATPVDAEDEKGPTFSVEEVMVEFRAELEKQLA